MARSKQAIELQRSLFSFSTGDIPPCHDRPGLNGYRRLCYTCAYAERDGNILFCRRHVMVISVRDKYGLKEWKALREQILDRDKRRCRLCGAGKYLHIHHRDGDRTNDAQENLVTLCESCHRRVHTHLAHIPEIPAGQDDDSAP
ncbi:HNH endonuclease [Methanogenium organophilum]|uniref:HNH endonuclease n=1 Tax=Methanogenium organophilum TaxID=2199 RepID=A0A9X9S492_METOG|nr:HNH endonuclease [Methanogenium organophilum]WAI00620.1 HNH endonuclease [Methanogenium organophilum]